jgi:transglutaminase-like putative cysteine protease
MLLQIEHQTVYRYAAPVTFGPHRILVRPLEGHDVQIRNSALTLEPAYRVRWVHDVFDNSVAMVDFLEPASEMSVLSRVVVEQYNTNPFDFILNPGAVELPFAYREGEKLDVMPFTGVEYPRDQDAVLNWVRPFLKMDGRAQTFEFLTALNKSFPLFFQYVRREEPGVQSPGETLRKRAGSCRDFALLFMEAARHLGLAARFVSGYLCRHGDDVPDLASNATHAWAEIYLPGAGWKGFDPTCGVLAADLHVRVAVVRQAAQATPVHGTFSGRPDDYRGMTVTVDARVVTEPHLSPKI